MLKAIRSRPLAQASLFATLALLAAPAFAQSLSLLDARVVEGTGQQSMLLFEARLSAPASGKVSFDFNTSDGTAVSTNDYQQLPLVGLLSIPAGQTSLMISVPVISDSAIEPNEYVNATISNVVGASAGNATAKGLIVNDDFMMLQSAPASAAAQTGSTGQSSGTSSLSSDGRFVAFTSNASDIVPGRGSNRVQNVYVRDNRTGVTTIASVAANGGDTNNDCNNPVLSADARYVVFTCNGSGLVANDGSNNLPDVYRRDLLTGTTSLVSVNRTGSGTAGGFSFGGKPSADGRYIAFQSSASDLVAVDTNNVYDVFIRDMQTGTTTLVSVGPDGIDSAPEAASSPALSADGRYVAFSKEGKGVWRRDMQLGVSTLVSVATSGGNANSTSYNGGISADGRYVVFNSYATDLGGPYPVSTPQIYVRDVLAGTTKMVSVAPGGTTSLDSSANSPSISADGRYVAFQSLGKATADDLDTNEDVFVRDLQANTTIRVSKPWTGASSTGASSRLATISGDGRFVAFLSSSTQLLPGDGNGQDDVFRLELPADSSLPALSIYDMWVTEGDSGSLQANFYVGVSAPVSTPVVFDFDTSDGTAVAGSDYDARNLVAQTIPVGQYWTTIAIPINGDTVQEADEALNVYLSHVTGARLVDGQALLIIGNNDTPPALSIGDVSISEGNAGTQLASFPVTLSHTSPTAVSFDIATADGTASAGSDYVALAQTGVTIPAGSNSAIVSVVINGDGVVEGNETFTLTASNVTGATVSDGQAVGTISNDDAYPALTIGDVSISEGNSGTSLATFTVSLSAPAASPVSYYIGTADGTATGASDYAFRALTFQTIPVGASSATFTVSINGDYAVEADETFQVNVSSVVGATVLDGQAIGTINNDDVLPSLSIADVSISEGNSGTKLATFTVQLSAPAGAPVTYSYATANGSAVAPGDYVALSGSSTISTGASSQSLTVTINGDTAIEPTETFALNISGVSNATVVDGSAVGTITNDDFLPTLSIGDVSIAEGNNGSSQATFTVTLSAASASSVGFTAATANGTAVAPGDYGAMAPTALAISPGALSKTFTVSIKGDKTVESNETFLVNLSNPSGATIADGQAVGTIVNDDATKFTLSRVSTGGLYDDVDDGRGDPAVSPREYAMLLLDSAQQVCARAGGASIVGIDGVENLAVLADLADTANHLCARGPHYSAALKAGGSGLGFLVDGVAGKANPHGTQVLELATLGKNAHATSMTVLAEGHARPLTVLLAATPSTNARERASQAAELDGLVHARLTADPRARLVVLDAEKFWVSPAVQEEFASVRLDMPAAKPAQQVLQLQP